MDTGRHSSLQIRSQLMFAIWDGFKAAGINIPHPQRNLCIKVWLGQTSDQSMAMQDSNPSEPPLQVTLLHKPSN